MSAKHRKTQKHSKQHETKQPKSGPGTGQSKAAPNDKDTKKRPDRIAGDVDEETRSDDAPYNKTYGRHE